VAEPECLGPFEGYPGAPVVSLLFGLPAAIVLNLLTDDLQPFTHGSQLRSTLI